ncbi:MAG: hypothetical protein J6X02_04340 [Bacilli bacterium]|nr:hypothetical protein [Bacilli bacterium]
MKNDFYGSVGASDLQTNNETRANNGYYNQYDDNFYNQGPKYSQHQLDLEKAKRRKQEVDNIVGAVILLIVIVVLLVIFVIPNLDFNL